MASLVCLTVLCVLHFEVGLCDALVQSWLDCLLWIIPLWLLSVLVLVLTMTLACLSLVVEYCHHSQMPSVHSGLIGLSQWAKLLAVRLQELLALFQDLAP